LSIEKGRGIRGEGKKIDNKKFTETSERERGP